MAKTGKQVQGDVYQMLKDSALCSMISGAVYRGGYRPRDSHKEDVVVIFTAGIPDQIQTGVVTVNIFVPDIDPYDNGVLVEDGERTAELERYAQGRWPVRHKVLLSIQIAADNYYDGRTRHQSTFHCRSALLSIL